MLRRTYVLIPALATLALVGSERLPAQEAEPLEEVAARIINAARANIRVMEMTQHLTDWIGPRLVGTPQAEKAIRWSAERMRADGRRPGKGRRLV